MTAFVYQLPEVMLRKVDFFYLRLVILNPYQRFGGHNSHFWLNVICLMHRQPLTDLRLIIVEASKSHSDTPQLLGLLWTSDQLLATHNTHKKPISMPLGGIRTRNRRKQLAADPRVDRATNGIDCYSFQRWRKYNVLGLEEPQKFYVVKPEF